MQDNIVKFPKKVSIFTEAQKQRLCENIEDMTDCPKQVIDTVEQTLCTQAVEITRELSAIAAERLGNAIVRYLFRH